MSNLVNATVRTVSNNANSPGQYTDLQVAINASVSNDTLYVHGSPIDYGTATSTKPLTIIGAGALPNKSYSYSTKINNLTLGFNTLYTSSAAGSKIYGCDIYYLNLSAGNGTTVAGISNILISRNKISACFFGQQGTVYTLAHNNITISNNVISSIGGGNNSMQFLIKNTIIKNNIINGQIYCLGHESAGSWLLSNNIIKGSIFIQIRSGVISNNIFYGTGGNNFGTNNFYCSVSNNCFLSGGFTYLPSSIIYGTNTGGGNLLNVDPLFVNETSASVISYDQTYPATGPFTNYNLQAGSLCLLYGSDGTDLGIYGGTTPFVEGYPAESRYRYFPMPAIPQMLNMNINNSSIPPAGTLNVDFKARKQN